MNTQTTFTFKFFGWLEAQAKHWTNPDGSKGGIVALDANIHASITLPTDTIVGPRASIGYGASIGARASIGDGASIGDDASIGYGVSIGARASIGDGSGIGYGAIIGARASIGDGSGIGYGAIIGARANIGNDASIGPRASIGDGASIGPRASIGDGASIGDDASIGYRANIGNDASIGYGDWFICVGPIGSRNATATAVYNKEHNLRWWVGCQYGISTDYLKERINNTHGDNEHAENYLAAVQFVENHPGLAKARAK